MPAKRAGSLSPFHSYDRTTACRSCIRSVEETPSAADTWILTMTLGAGGSPARVRAVVADTVDVVAGLRQNGVLGPGGGTGWRLPTLIAAAMVVLVLCAGCGTHKTGAATPVRDLDIERSYDVPSRKHVTTRVQYPQTPPVGGDHVSDVQRCGFYTGAIPAERGVHSMEHGAVWVTYRPDLPKQDVAKLRELAQAQTRLLVSRWDDGLPAPVVASAWGHQIYVSSAADPHLQEFIDTYISGARAPEPGAFC